YTYFVPFGLYIGQNFSIPAGQSIMLNAAAGVGSYTWNIAPANPPIASPTWTNTPNGSFTATPSATPTISPTDTATPSITLTPTPTPTDSPSWTPTATPSVTLTPSPSPSDSP